MADRRSFAVALTLGFALGLTRQRPALADEARDERPFVLAAGGTWRTSLPGPGFGRRIDAPGTPCRRQTDGRGTITATPFPRRNRHRARRDLRRPFSPFGRVSPRHHRTWHRFGAAEAFETSSRAPSSGSAATPSLPVMTAAFIARDCPRAFARRQNAVLGPRQPLARAAGGENCRLLFPLRASRPRIPRASSFTGNPCAPKLPRCKACLRAARS